MLLCFLCATPSLDPYFPLRCWQLTVPVQRCGFSPSPVSPVPAAAVLFNFFWQLVSGMSGSRTNVEGWKPAVTRQREGSASPDVAVCCGACPGAQQRSIGACLPTIWSNSSEHSPSTGCLCAALIAQLEAPVNVAWFDLCNCHLIKSWLSYRDCAESGLSGKLLWFFFFF